MNRSRQQDMNLRQSLSNFFFEEQVPFGAALTRIFLPLMALLPMLMRFPRVRELYSSDGTPVQMFEVYGNGEVLPVLNPGPAIMLYSLMVFCLLCGVVGWRTRLSLCIGTGPLYLFQSTGRYRHDDEIQRHCESPAAIADSIAVWSVVVG